MRSPTVTGIQTVKANALEPAMAKRWDNQLAAYVSASFRTQTLASYGHEGVNLIGKVASAVMLWYGARLVMDQELSVGQFVAFNSCPPPFRSSCAPMRCRACYGLARRPCRT
jgi:subfamily B ATP-binding cassette protein HlyB/CyaB